MKEDAFDDVQCPFDYKEELKKAREVLDAKVGRYMSDHRAKDYRWLSKKFGISPAKLSGIAKGYRHKRSRGRRSQTPTPQDVISQSEFHLP